VAAASFTSIKKAVDDGTYRIASEPIAG
jgi:hypothetical protein